MLKETKILNCNAVVYSPDGTTTKLPTVIFFPGLDEDAAHGGIEKLYVNGPAVYLQKGWKPSFNVICIQPTYGWIPPTVVDQFVDAVQKSEYFVDPNSTHLTGLSAGAYAIFTYLATIPTASSKIASVVPMSNGDTPTDPSCFKTVSLWCFAGNLDSNIPAKMSALVTAVKALPQDARMTIYSGGHGLWNNFYNPTYIDPVDKNSIYDFMISKSKVLINPLPKSGKVITLTPDSSGQIYITDVKGKLNPQDGDTLLIPADKKILSVYLENFAGVSAPIWIECADPAALIGGYGPYGTVIKNAQNFVVQKATFDGGGTSNIALGIGNGCKNYILQDILVQNSAAIGLQAKWNPVVGDPKSAYPTTIDNVIIRRVKSQNNKCENYYIGNTYSEDASSTGLLPAQFNGLLLEDLESYNSGWDGIQVAGAAKLTARRLKVNNFGISNTSGQQNGLLLGAWVITTDEGIHDFDVEEGTGAGLICFGRGKMNISNGKLIHTAKTAGESAIYVDDYADNGMNLPPLQLNFKNIQIDGAAKVPVFIANYKGTMLKGTLDTITWANVANPVPYDGSSSVWTNCTSQPNLPPPPKKVLGSATVTIGSLPPATVTIYDDGSKDVK